MVKAMKVEVSQRALVARVNRALLKQGEQLRAARGAKAVQDLGNYFVVDVSRESVVAKGVDLESYARELGVLKKYEKVSGEAQ